MFGIDTILAFLALVVGFGFLIFVHELGHFAVAKWVGIRCTQFAIGFGQSMATWRKGIGFRVGTTEPEYIRRAVEHLRNQGVAPTGEGNAENPMPGGFSPRQVYEAGDELGLGETEYRFNWVPLGGYVKMVGQEDMDPTARSSDPRSFNNKPIWARACVISAGVVMNVIFGFLFFIIAFSLGVQFPAPVVGATVPGSPAATTYAQGHDGDADYLGLQVGDRVTSVDGDEVRDLTAISIATALSSPGDKLTLGVERDGTDQPLKYVIAPAHIEGQPFLSAGIVPAADLTLGAVTDAAQQEAGLKEGMRLVSVGGEPVADFGAFSRRFDQPTGPVDLTFEGTEGETATVSASAQPQLQFDAEASALHLLGFVPATVIYPQAESPAAKAGLKSGDLLQQIGPMTWPSTRDVMETVVEGDGEPVAVTVLRDGKPVSFEPIEPKNNRLGIAIRPAMQTLVFRTTLPGTPAAALQLPAGSRITAIAGQPVSSWGELLQRLNDLVTPDEATEVEMTFAVNLAGQPTETHTLTITPEQATAVASTGWSPPTDFGFESLLVTVQAKNPIEAGALGVEYTRQFIAQTYLTLLRVFQRTVPASELRGPVGIIDAGTRVAKEGASRLLFFLGLISINLAVINFLPIPIVDGGLMVFLMIEKIKGSPASPAVQVAAMWIGLALIGSVFLFVTYHDLARLATGG